MSRFKLPQASGRFATQRCISRQIELQPGVTLWSPQGLSLPFLLRHMLLTQPENCVMEACGAVIPSTAGVSCKEPLMRPPVNKPLCTAVATEETKRDTTWYRPHVAPGSPLPRAAELLFFSKKGKETGFFWSIVPRRKLLPLIWVFVLFFLTIWGLPNIYFHWCFAVARTSNSLSSLKIHVPPFELMCPKHLGQDQLIFAITCNELFLVDPTL